MARNLGYATPGVFHRDRFALLKKAFFAVMGLAVGVSIIVGSCWLAPVIYRECSLRLERRRAAAACLGYTLPGDRVVFDESTRKASGRQLTGTFGHRPEDFEWRLTRTTPMDVAAYKDEFWTIHQHLWGGFDPPPPPRKPAPWPWGEVSPPALLSLYKTEQDIYPRNIACAEGIRTPHPTIANGRSRDGGYASLVFLHELRSKGGNKRLVAITFDGPGFLWQLKPFHFVLYDPDVIFSRFARVGGGSVTPAGFPVDDEKLFKLFAGQPDPMDPSHFTIAFSAGDQSGIIDGRLENDQSVRLVVRDRG